MRRGADVFESRRVLASALIAPAVIFIVLLVGTPFVLAIYLSFTDATAGSLSGSWVGLDNFSTRVARPDLQARAAQHGCDDAPLAGDRRRLRGDPRELPREAVPRAAGSCAS